MLRKGDFVEIQALAKAGVYQKDIAAKLSPRRKTVPRTATYGSAHWSVCELRKSLGHMGRRTPSLRPRRQKPGSLLGTGLPSCTAALDCGQGDPTVPSLSLKHDQLLLAVPAAGLETVEVDASTGRSPGVPATVPDNLMRPSILFGFQQRPGKATGNVRDMQSCHCMPSK